MADKPTYEELERRNRQLQGRLDALEEQAVLRRRKEKALIPCEKILVEDLVKSYFLYSIDYRGVITYVSQSVTNVLGYAQHEFLTHFPKHLTNNPINDQAATITALSMQGEQQSSYDIECYHKDGSICWLEISEVPVIEADGKLRSVECIVRDITERKRATEGLQASIKKLRNALAGTIQAIALIVETRDPYTAGHQRRVADIARAIAQEMGLSESQVDGIRIAGVIHDLGKLSIPAEILSKPGQLTSLEYSLIKTHPQAGYEILKEIFFQWPIAQIVLQHHERMDGSGYPQGIKGNDILLEARVIAVADVVEAMASHRPYRPALGGDSAMEEILRNKGQLYDPDVVKACISYFQKKGFQLD